MLALFAVFVLVWGCVMEWRMYKRKPKGALKLKNRVTALEAQVSGVPGADWVNHVDGELKVLADKVAFSTPAKLALIVERVNKVSVDQEAAAAKVLEMEKRFASLEQAAKWQGIMKRGE